MCLLHFMASYKYLTASFLCRFPLTYFLIMFHMEPFLLPQFRLRSLFFIYLSVHFFENFGVFLVFGSLGNDINNGTLP